MSQNSTIDSIFKNQLEQMEQPGAEENWLRLEKELLAQQKRKRRAGAWLLGLLLLLGGSAALVWGLERHGKTEADGVVAESTPQAKTTPGAVTAQSPTMVGTQPLTNTANSAQASTATSVVAYANTNSNRLQQKARRNITFAGGDMAVDDVAAKNPLGFDKKGSQKIRIGAPTAAADNEVVAKASDAMMASEGTVTQAPVTSEPTMEPKENYAKEPQALETMANHAEPLMDAPNDNEPKTAIRKDKKTPLPSPQLELAAGVDVSNGYVGSGKYAMAMVRLALNKKANILVGAGYASNAMSESYKQADKPNLLNQEVDAKVRGLSMLQFPILYEQAIKENKLMFRAGITPVYIMDASIVNIPNSFGGNPANYRTFTLKDINRLNVLFTAGLQIRLTQRLGIEFKAHYGLTELVKNSYINQSGENNNFKSTQVGLLLMLGKKR